VFDKVLVANRGEIAVRILRALRDLGIPSVAVYSDVDRRSPHVRLADEAVLIGQAPPLSSYLRIEALLEAARLTGASALHPGYGFLAENASFAAACEDAGLAFIGPTSAAIRTMGDKLAAREAALQAAVPLVPGTRLQDPTDDGVLRAANEIGYPLLLKSVGGGGGKGMRVVHAEKDLLSAFRGARSEASKAFDNPEIYVEKYLARARHVEIQVVGDLHGSHVHLGERECSVQRRHQKVVEETPCPSLSDGVRHEMTAAALDLCRRIGYTSLGTVEFLVDFEANFYFLEMNTRLQVEHPVTELVTGLDLVTLQIEIARGKKLPFTQDEVHFSGHAIEARLCAEDPYGGFVPAVGTIEELELPTGPGIRVDSGIDLGLEVSLHYDPILAKIISWGPDRGVAISRLRRALSELRLGGVRTTSPLILEVLEHESFQKGVWDTALLERWLRERKGVTIPESANGGLGARETAALAAVILRHVRERGAGSRVQHGASGPPRESPWLLRARNEATGGSDWGDSA